jgi:hypothetical protein
MEANERDRRIGGVQFDLDELLLDMTNPGFADHPIGFSRMSGPDYDYASGAFRHPGYGQGHICRRLHVLVPPNVNAIARQAGGYGRDAIFVRVAVR